jgi:hypothetical protein
MDQAFFETSVKGIEHGDKKNDIQYIHMTELKRHKLTEFFGNLIMFLRLAINGVLRTGSRVSVPPGKTD